MKDIYIIHTQFNTAYSEYLNNSELSIERKEIDDEYGGTEMKDIGFGTTEPIAIIYFKNRIFVDFRCEILSEEHPEQIIVIVSDNLFYSNPNAVLERLKKIIKPTHCRLFPIYHQRETFNEFIATFEKEFENKISTPVKRYSHYKKEETEHWQDNPFYNLVELVNSTTENEYNKALGKLKSFFPSDKEIELNKRRREKMILLNKVILQSYRLLEEDITQLSVFLPDYDFRSYSPSKDKVKELRDFLLNNEI